MNEEQGTRKEQGTGTRNSEQRRKQGQETRKRKQGTRKKQK